ncbi:MAG: hypothetical protein KGI00_00760 [Candidatus Micrarchaeota archaeon]|nr:hypothetical protein [Candidatus Micrarchaeota archaeon]MDE1849241.1 hypothetical protein [Candidatus Micrarchaeota archaeon]
MKDDVEDAVDELLELQDIKEVLISEGDYGLIVRAYPTQGEDRLKDYLSKNFKGRFNEAVCYYAYSRRSIPLQR